MRGCARAGWTAYPDLIGNSNFIGGFLSLRPRVELGWLFTGGFESAGTNSSYSH